MANSDPPARPTVGRGSATARTHFEGVVACAKPSRSVSATARAHGKGSGPHDATPDWFAGARLLLLYDGWCGVCTRTAVWATRRDRAGRLRALPNQTAGLIEAFGLTRAEVDRAAWTVTASGERVAGAAAINATLRALDAPGWRLLGWLLDRPGLATVERVIYDWFAPRRGRFARWGMTPACARPSANCTPEGG